MSRPFKGDLFLGSTAPHLARGPRKPRRVPQKRSVVTATDRAPSPPFGSPAAPASAWAGPVDLIARPSAGSRLRSAGRISRSAVGLCTERSHKLRSGSDNQGKERLTKSGLPAFRSSTRADGGTDKGAPSRGKRAAVPHGKRHGGSLPSAWGRLREANRPTQSLSRT